MRRTPEQETPTFMYSLMALYSLILQMVVFDGVVNLQFGPHHTI
jgi:hypothetical protein